MGSEVAFGIGVMVGVGALKAAQKALGKLKRRFREEVISALKDEEDS
ncbi:hypothetical protein [Streptomyces triticiradicis]|nr:hypothetical protein [Streptomyces triticiradicis]